MTRPGYKMTEIGEIPEDWEVSRLESEKVSLYVKSGSTPLKREKDYWNGNIPFVTQSDMTNVDHYLRETSEKITELGLKSSNLVLVPKNSILLSMYGTIGKVVINKIPVTVSQNVSAIKLNVKNVNEEYSYYVIQQYSSQFKRHAKTITLSHLDNKIVKNAIVPFPSLPEQQKIAEILSTVDEAVQKVDEEITLTEKHKKGLMQTLLTKGIGHTNFKITEIGEIPEEWPLRTFSEVLQIRKRNNKGKSEKIYTIPMELIPENGTYCDYRSLSKNEVVPPTYCECGDILLPKITPSVENGKQGIVPTLPSGNAFATSEVYALVTNGSLTNIYTFYLLKLSLFRKPLIDSMVGTTGRQRVPKDSLFSLSFPVPPFPEQQKIAEILTAVDNKLELLGNKKAKLEKLKKGLMSDLLTGKIRVKLNTSKGED